MKHVQSSSSDAFPLSCGIVGKILDQFVILGVPCSEQNIVYREQHKPKIRFEIKDVFPKQTMNRGYLANLCCLCKKWCFRENVGIFDERGATLDIANGRVISENKEAIKISEKGSLQHFVITNENGQRKYCTSLQVYELRRISFGDDQQRLVYVPKAYCILSCFNCFEVHKQILCYIFKEVVFPVLAGVTDKGVLFSERMVSTFEKYANNYGFREAQKMQLQSQTDSLNLRVKEEHLLGFILSQILAFEKRQNCDFTKQMKILINNKEFFSFKFNPTHSLRPFFYLDNFSYKPLLQKLSIATIAEILQAIFLEKQIIIFAKDTSDIAHLCEALFAFIQPLTWRCLYIPSLPTEMLETFEIIVPYIIGINRNVKDQILSTVSSDNKLFLDYDTDYIIQDGIEMPAELKSSLKEQLKAQMRAYKDNLKQKKDLSTADQSLAFSKLILDMKKVFLHFMISLINNYCSFFLFPSDFDYQRSTENEIFDFKSYLRFLGPSHFLFYTDFVTKTMIFRGLVEDTYKVMRQVEVFGKELREACQSENASPFLTEFILEVKKVREYLLLDGNDRKGISNVNLYDYPDLLSTLNLEHNVIINNYLQELNKPKIIETKGELLKYLIFNSTNPNLITPFYSTSQSRNPSIAPEQIEVVPILDLELIENHADKTIFCKQEQGKKFKEGSKILDKTLEIEEKANEINIPFLTKQMTIISSEQQIQESSNQDIIFTYPSLNRNLHLSQAHSQQTLSTQQQFNTECSLSLESDTISREAKTIKIPFVNSSRSPTLRLEQNLHEKKKNKIFDFPTMIGGCRSQPSISRDRFNGDRENKNNFMQNKLISNQPREDLIDEDLPNKSDIPEENVVETVPDFFRGEMEMKNIVNLNIDQITSCHTFKVKVSDKINKFPLNPAFNSHLSEKNDQLKTDPLKSIKNHFFFADSSSLRQSQISSDKKIINSRAPFSQIPANESWRYNSEMINTSSNFLKTEGDDGLNLKYKIDVTQNTIMAGEEEKVFQTSGLISPIKISNNQSLNSFATAKTSNSYIQPTLPIYSPSSTSIKLNKQTSKIFQILAPKQTSQQSNINTQSSRTWAQKKVDFFHTENVQEEEETESLTTEPNYNVVQNPASFQLNSIRIKDDPMNLKEYFSYSKQQSKLSNQFKDNSNNSITSLTTNPAQCSFIQDNINKRRSFNSSHTMLAQISTQLQQRQKTPKENEEFKVNLKSPIFSQTNTQIDSSPSKIRTSSSHFNQNSIGNKLKAQDQVSSSFSIKTSDYNLKFSETKYSDTYSRFFPKETKITQATPLKDINNQPQAFSTVQKRLSSQPSSNKKIIEDQQQGNPSRYSFDKGGTIPIYSQEIQGTISAQQNQGRTSSLEKGGEKLSGNIANHSVIQTHNIKWNNNNKVSSNINNYSNYNINNNSNSNSNYSINNNSSSNITTNSNFTTINSNNNNNNNNNIPNLSFFKPAHKVPTQQFQQLLEGKGLNILNKENSQRRFF